MLKDLRSIFALPLIVIAIIIMRVAEVIQGEKLTYRGKEAVKAYLKASSFRCKECLHEGQPEIINNK